VKLTEQALWPEGGGLDGFVAVLALIAFIAFKGFKAALMPVIGGCALVGLLWELIR
jgi:hypothetical protein